MSNIVPPTLKDIQMKSQTSLLLALVAGSILWSFRANGQIIPDNSLGAESSAVIPGIEGDRIDGGAVRGANLFHSFREFNVNSGAAAYFTNPEGIENILSRVTGGNISNIFGTLGVLGNANLFLINPAGIVFGPNARLDLGGSFVGSTADRVVFGNGFEFSATNPQAPPLLTINIPIGLKFRENPGAIVLRGPGLNAPDIFDPEIERDFEEEFLRDSRGLRVSSDKTLALVGGAIDFNGGILAAPSGRIELGSVADRGAVSLTPTNTGLALSYEGVSSYGDIQLSGQSVVFAGGVRGGGDIQVRGRRIGLESSRIEINSLGEIPGGTLRVHATESVVLEGTTDGKISILGSRSFGEGDAGDVTLNTQRLIVTDGSVIGAETFVGRGRGGNLILQASESVLVSGTSPDGEFSSEIGAGSEGAGDAGNVTISTRRLIIRDGAEVDVDTLGEGMGGTLTVGASSSVLVSGSILGSETEGSGNAGSVRISTEQLTIRDGAKVGAETTGAGDAGNVTILTGQLTIENGGIAGAQTLGEGNGGMVTVLASESVLVRGVSPDGESSLLGAVTEGAGDAGNVTIFTGRLITRDGGRIIVGTEGEGRGGTLTVRASESVELSGRSVNDSFIVFDESSIALGAFTRGTGDAGDITIETGQLIVRNGGRVLVDTLGAGRAGNLTVHASESVELKNGLLGAATINMGDAGNIDIETERLTLQPDSIVVVSGSGSGNPGSISIVADQVRLRDRSAIEAESATGRGGNIALEARDLQLRNGSQISAAGSETDRTTEGNININAETIVLLAGSSIITNAADPAGGSNINIAPIEGSALVVLKSPDSTINAVGELELEGEIEVAPVEITQDADVVDAASLIGKDFCAVRGESSFTNVGRGGLPNNPGEMLGGNNVRVGLVEPAFPSVVQSSGPEDPQSEKPRSHSVASIVPARGWIFQPDGSVRLVGYVPTGTAAVERLPNSQSCRSN